MKKKLLLLFVVIVTIALSASAYFNYSCDFSGKVGSYPVVGNFELGTTGEIWGIYGYKKNGKNPKSMLELTGEWTSSSSNKFKMNMVEYSDGRATGRWNVVYNSSTRKMTGTMTTNGKTYNVNITTRNISIMN